MYTIEKVHTAAGGLGGVCVGAAAQNSQQQQQTNKINQGEGAKKNEQRPPPLLLLLLFILRFYILLYLFIKIILYIYNIRKQLEEKVSDVVQHVRLL